MSKKRRKNKNSKRKDSVSLISKFSVKLKYLIFVLMLFVLFVFLYILLFKSPYFILEKIDITGEYPLSVEKILDQTQIQTGKSIWSVNLKETSKLLIKYYPEYKQIEIKRLLPHCLVFDFTLRKPIAQIKSGRYYLSDSSGFILPQVHNIAVCELPVITGIDSQLVGLKPGKESDSKALLNSLDLLKAVALSDVFSIKEVEYIDASDYKNLLLEFKSGIIVKIGDTQYKQRIDKLKYVLDEIDQKNIKYIDLRFKDPVLTPR